MHKLKQFQELISNSMRFEILPLALCHGLVFLRQAWWAFDDNASEPGVGELAGWLSITRRRSYRPSPLNKYRKFAPDGSDILGEQPEEESTEVDDSTSATSAEDVVNESTSQERSLKERLGNATELDVLAQDFNWSNLLSVHRTEHAESEEDDEANPRDSIGSVEVCLQSFSFSLSLLELKSLDPQSVNTKIPSKVWVISCIEVHGSITYQKILIPVNLKLHCC